MVYGNCIHGLIFINNYLDVNEYPDAIFVSEHSYKIRLPIEKN